MPYVKRKGERGERYWVIGRECIGCSCFTPGEYQHRSAASAGGSRTNGTTTLCCLSNAYRGCPGDAQRGFTPERRAERQAEGWKNET
jgi:hypothetical protein